LFKQLLMSISEFIRALPGIPKENQDELLQAFAKPDNQEQKLKILEILSSLVLAAKQYQSRLVLAPTYRVVLANCIMENLHGLTNALAMANASFYDPLRLGTMGYVNSQFTWFFPSPKAIAEIAKQIGTALALEVGCGNGLLVAFLADLQDKYIQAIDVSQPITPFYDVTICDGSLVPYADMNPSVLLIVWPSRQQEDEANLLGTLRSFWSNKSVLQSSKKVIIVGTPTRRGKLIGCHGTQRFWDFLNGNLIIHSQENVPSSLPYDADREFVTVYSPAIHEQVTHACVPQCLGPLESQMLQSGLTKVSPEVWKEIYDQFLRIIELLEAYQRREDLPLSERVNLVNEILQIMPRFVQFVKDHTDKTSSWEFVLFSHLNKRVTWVLPSQVLIQAIIKHADGGITECGAGTGLLAAQLLDSGQVVFPIDCGLRRYDMKFTNVERICGSSVCFNGRRTLLMCWPESDPDNDSKMLAMLRNFHAAGGTTVLVSGTPPNDKGKCYGPQGTQALWDCLFRLFTETDRIQVPSFMKVLPESLVVLKRK